MEIGLYIHIPFCIKKCNYCDFSSYKLDNESKNKFIDGLIKEMKMYSDMYKDREFLTVFIGGGTPTILDTKELKYILDNINKHFKINKDAEITIESNPGTLEKEKLKELYELGVNRLSIGVQAYQTKHLNTLGRIHTFKEFEESFKSALEVGFRNINVDLMFSLPNQTMKEWKETLQKVVDLNPTHISTYSLIIEEGTKFYDMYKSGEIVDIDQNLDRQMYYYAREYLSKNGYNQYEISNFSKKGYECRHNIIYWKCKEYLGLGPSAHSYINKIRFSNYSTIDTYLEILNNKNLPIDDRNELTFKDRLEEKIFMGLRMNEGIDVYEINEEFNIDIKNLYKETINKLVNDGYLKCNNNRVHLTNKGIDFSNKVFIEFLQD
ncbi:radical SAM family heme chaperone HemW [Alkalithermobacter paradoxus]|uniref:Heme chaperone HemW n=1 Tax=Alkalithermobacter paradoxus TaxID=29349 RepID=A0A1V4I6U5_9FIRM|nr:oxygen-independent coproporphyrinogen-III oxidase-like protein YqeR [[Clostridium] thermoalcaliphilum]